MSWSSVHIVSPDNRLVFQWLSSSDNQFKWELKVSSCDFFTSLGPFGELACTLSERKFGSISKFGLNSVDTDLVLDGDWESGEVGLKEIHTCTTFHSIHEEKVSRLDTISEELD